ncbi:MAG: hypothetical protein ABEI74_04250 [Candidatus Pacearchaeota archaeon]
MEGEVEGIKDESPKSMNGSIEGMKNVSYSKDCVNKVISDSSEKKDVFLKFEKDCKNKQVKINGNLFTNLSASSSGYLKLREGEVREANLTAGSGGSKFNINGAEINVSEGETLIYKKNVLKIKGKKEASISINDQESFSGTRIEKGKNVIMDLGEHLTIRKGSVQVTKNGYIINAPQNSKEGANFEYRDIRMFGQTNGFPIKINEGSRVDQDYEGHYVHRSENGYFVESHHKGGQLTMRFTEGNEVFETPEGTFTSITTRFGERLEILKAGHYNQELERKEYLSGVGRGYVDKPDLDILKDLDGDSDYPLIKHSIPEDAPIDNRKVIIENGASKIETSRGTYSGSIKSTFNSQAGLDPQESDSSSLIFRSSLLNSGPTNPGGERKEQFVFNEGISKGFAKVDANQKLKGLNETDFRKGTSYNSDPQYRFRNENSKKAYSFLKGQIGKPWAYGSLGDKYFDEQAGEWREVPASQTAWDCISLCKVTAAKATPGVSEEDAKRWPSDMRLKGVLENYGWRATEIEAPESDSEEEINEVKDRISETDALSVVLEMKKVSEEDIREDGTVVVDGNVLEEGVDYVTQNGEIWRLNHALIRGTNSKRPTMIEANMVGQRYMPQSAFEYNDQQLRQGNKKFFDGIVRSKNYEPQENRKLIILEPPQTTE